MAKNHKSNGVPAWAAVQLRVLKGATLRLMAETAEIKVLITETRVQTAEIRAESAKTKAQHEAWMAQNENLLVEWKQEHRAEMSGIRQEMRDFKKISDLHSRAIIELLRKK